MTKVNFKDLSTFNRATHYITKEGEVVKRSWGERIVRTLHLESFVNKIVARIFPSLYFVNQHIIPSPEFRRNIQDAADLEPNKALVAAGIAKINELIDHICLVSHEELDHVILDNKEVSPEQSDEEEESSSVEELVNVREATPPLPEVEEDKAPATPPQQRIEGANSITSVDPTVPVTDTATPGVLDDIFDFESLSSGEEIVIDDEDVGTKVAPELVHSFIIDVREDAPQTIEEVKPVEHKVQKLSARIIAQEAEEANPGTKQRAKYLLK
ncbi:MAG: hypothetical protein LLF94_07650 [Chlamydiales bacterium]|nr:hypothetical protein [Chlamydiales bacterium]